jgi:hypothetical protein
MEVCPICLVPADETLKVGPCEHVAHPACIADWRARSNSCPVCREKLDDGPDPIKEEEELDERLLEEGLEDEVDRWVGAIERENALETMRQSSIRLALAQQRSQEARIRLELLNVQLQTLRTLLAGGLDPESFASLAAQTLQGSTNSTMDT